MTGYLKREYGAFALALLSLLTGVIAGLGAVFFRAMIAFCHNMLFLGQFSFSYDATIHTPPSPWGNFVILAPVIGAAGVIFLVRNFAPEAKGHGVPEVMDAIYHEKGIIRPVVAVVKSLASAICIGSGGSVGREGPIVQIGSAFGSSLGQLLRMPPWQCITLIAAGAGGGIAATFNTPVGGLLFATEIILHEVSVRTLIPVFISTATATYLGQIFFGPHPAFVIPDLETPYFHLANPLVLLSYVGLGLVIGVVSAGYIKLLYALEDLLERHIPRKEYLRHMGGMFLVGLIFLLLQKWGGHYYIEGVGYSAIQDILTGTVQSAGFLVLLFVLKLLATSLTLGSGGSGGIFSPSLFIGAALGGAYGLVLNMLIPALGISSPAFAIAGMAGVAGGATGAALTAVVMILEMTLDYNVVIPLTITVAISFGIRRLFCRESIYTLKLVRRGHYVPDAMHSDVSSLKRASEMMDARFTVVPSTMTIHDFSALVNRMPEMRWYVLEDSGRVVAVLSREQAFETLLLPNGVATIAESALLNWVMAGEDEPFYTVLAHMRIANAEHALVTVGASGSVADIRGVIGSEQIAEGLKETVELFSS